jgi:hypothetical protein
VVNPFVSLRVPGGHLNTLLAQVALAIVVTLPGVARTRPAHHVQSGRDADYVAALATANRFLYAWQIHDEETGVLLLTVAAKKASSEDKVADFFSAAVATYEIGRGRKVKAGFYVFPLALYSVGGGKDDRCHPRYTQVSVVKTGKEDWGIDTLP